MKRITDAERARALQILDRLDASMPEAKIELDYATPLQLLMAVLLAAQCTDKRVNLVTPPLFAAFPTAASLAASSPPELEPYIASLGLFRNKARALVALGQALVRDHAGVVPIDRALLAELPGVGAKTAGVVALHLQGTPSFPVDTHVGRLARRMDFSRESDPEKVEADLVRLVPQPRWEKGHQLLVWHGRRTCFALKPACASCVVETLCPRRNVKPAKAKT
jgi:endonuclease-3